MQALQNVPEIIFCNLPNKNIIQSPNPMKSQIVLPKNLPERFNTDQQPFLFKKPLKAKNFVFARNWSEKFDKKFKTPFHSHQQQSPQQRIFVPKLKSKQLLRQPKFFFSVERKKQKYQQSEPFFDQVKIQNPQMRGSKTKSFYSNMFLSRKQSLRETDKSEQFFFSPKKSQNQKLTTYSSQALNMNDILQQQTPMNRKYSCISPSEKVSETKMSRRPNLHQNISFLIRRKREIKSKTTLSRINLSKHQLTEFVKSPDEDKL